MIDQGCGEGAGGRVGGGRGVGGCVRVEQVVCTHELGSHSTQVQTSGDEPVGPKMDGSGIGTEHYEKETEKRQKIDRQETKKDAEDLTLPAQAWSACPDASICPQQIGRYWPRFVLLPQQMPPGGQNGHAVHAELLLLVI